MVINNEIKNTLNKVLEILKKIKKDKNQIED